MNDSNGSSSMWAVTRPSPGGAFRTGPQRDDRVAVGVDPHRDASRIWYFAERVRHIPGHFALTAGEELARRDFDFRSRPVDVRVARDLDHVGDRRFCVHLSMFSPWATNEGSEWTTHVPAGGSGAVARPRRRSGSDQQEQAAAQRTTSPNPRLRLFMTPSKEALIELNPLLHENLGSSNSSLLDGSKRNFRCRATPPRGY